MNLRYPRRLGQSTNASSIRMGEEGFCVTVILCLVVTRHGIFSIEEVSLVPHGKGSYSTNHEARRGLCTIAPPRISYDPQRAHVQNPSRGDAKVNVFMINNNSSESSLVDSKLPL
jgi:hypothetical protein